MKTQDKPTQKTNITPFERLERYINKIANDYGASIIKSTDSRYYKFNGRVLRLSNHIGKNSSGAISILVPYGTSEKNDLYILHIHSSGNVQTLNLKQVKEFIRTFALISDFMEPIINKSMTSNVYLEPTINRSIASNVSEQPDSGIFGYPCEFFSEKQLSQIRLFIRQNKLSK